MRYSTNIMCYDMTYMHVKGKCTETLWCLFKCYNYHVRLFCYISYLHRSVKLVTYVTAMWQYACLMYIYYINIPLMAIGHVKMSTLEGKCPNRLCLSWRDVFHLRWTFSHVQWPPCSGTFITCFFIYPFQIWKGYMPCIFVGLRWASLVTIGHN